MRKVFVDLGANIGEVSARFWKEHPEFDIVCVEPNPALLGDIFRQSVKVGKYFNVIWAAAWTSDGVVNLFQSTAHQASTVVSGKIEHSGWPQVDYSSGSAVPSMDFSAWLRRTLVGYDEIVVKMDIEGAEYDVLDRMIADRTLGLVSRLSCEWHVDRYPAIGQARHDALKHKVGELTLLEHWD